MFTVSVTGSVLVVAVGKTVELETVSVRKGERV